MEKRGKAWMGLVLAALVGLGGCGQGPAPASQPAESASQPAESVSQPAESASQPAESASQPAEAAQAGQTALPFPADSLGTPAFTLTLPLPEGWEARPLPQQGDTTPRFWATGTGYALFDGERQVGGVGYGTYAWYPDTGNYRSVYSSLMLGSLASWDVDYTPVRDGGTASGTAICRPVYKPVEDYPELSAVQVPEEQCLGILAHDARLLAYVNLWFAPDALSWEELKEMAQGLTLEPDQSLEEALTAQEAPAALEEALAGMGRLPQGAAWDTEQSRVEWVEGQRAYVSPLSLGDPAVPCADYALGLGDGQVWRQQQGAWLPLEGRLSAQEAVDQLVASLSWEGEAFRLQIPWEWPDPAAWGLRVFGRLETEAGGMSFHALEEENQAHSWQAGGVYTFQAPQGFTELWLEAALEGEARTVDLLLLGR